MFPSELVKKGTKKELEFMEYWVRKLASEDDEKNWYVLNRALGTLWERSDFEKKDKQYGIKVLDRVWYPLSLLLSQVDLKKSIKKDFVQKGQQIGGGEYTPGSTEEVVNLGTETTKEQFLDFISKFGGAPKPPGLKTEAPSDSTKK
jgi:hypothetical protein